MRTNDEIKSIVENAFLPLRCGAEIWDHKNNLRFRVFGSNDQGVIDYPKLVLDQVRSDVSLSSILRQVRERVEAKGFALEPWEMPPQV